MIGTVSIAMKMNIPEFHPNFPNYFFKVSVKSKSVPAALITKYWVVKLTRKERKVRRMPYSRPDWLKAQGMVTRPVPTIAFQTEKMVVSDPCLPV